MLKLDLSRAHDPVAVEARLRRLERDQEIHIYHLGMASRRITADYPELAGWFCLQTKSGRDEVVEKALIEADVEALLLMKKPRHIMKRGRCHMLPARPIMPGYVLVRLVPSASAFAGLIALKDVINVVGGAVKPLRISDKNIKKFICMATGVPMPAEVAFVMDERVHIAVGPFAGMEAVVVRNANKGDLYGYVNITCGGNILPVTLPLDFIKKL